MAIMVKFSFQLLQELRIMKMWMDETKDKRRADTKLLKMISPTQGPKTEMNAIFKK